jgi:heme exporter protein D
MTSFKKMGLVFLAFVFALVVLIVIVITVQQHELTKHQVSNEEARKVVERFALDSRWENGEIILQEKLYNLNNKVRAYLFTHQVDGDNEHYIVVSALKNTSPILEYSSNEPPVKANPSFKGFYLLTNIVYEKSRATLIGKRWYKLPFMLPYVLDSNIVKKVEENKSKWSYYLDNEAPPPDK